ncbi:MobC family plasmid mobilization relaxosome protein [Spirosoma sp. BT702]|uniref:MobC family plasmid mobilization relaxosome protein n=1 Tax=Spirosoma profusum TaxID=2771354 RepID=A0A927AT76_9BACT|nr:MobC family plasmid mobilization relaxosome protein [Spirosoma profusum]MBD2699477.1 MobC family plasmid mobilization relaxosome protein [Spirosoma profusum]
MARPQKDGADKRDFTIRVRVTSAEKLSIWQMAADAGYTPSDFMRLRTMAATQPLRRVPTPERELLLNVMAELGRIGNNVNQIARALNSRDETGQLAGIEPDDINQAMQGLDALTSQVLKLLS